MPRRSTWWTPAPPTRPQNAPDRPVSGFAGVFERTLERWKVRAWQRRHRLPPADRASPVRARFAAAEFGHPAGTFVTSGITDGGEGRGRNRDDSHVMAAPGHPEASSHDDGMPQSPDSSPPPRPPGEKPPAPEPGGKPSQESQTEFSSQQIKSDKADNIGDPDRNNSVIARDENTGHNQTAAGLAPAAVDPPAVNSPAADDSTAAPSGAKAAAAGPVPSSGSVPPSGSEPPAGSVPPGTPEPAEPAATPAEDGEPETVQFAAIPADDEQTVIVPEPVARPAAAEPEHRARTSPSR